MKSPCDCSRHTLCTFNLEDEAHFVELLLLNQCDEMVRDKSAIGLWCGDLRDRDYCRSALQVAYQLPH